LEPNRSWHRSQRTSATAGPWQFAHYVSTCAFMICTGPGESTVLPHA
jgi:hypothetical protein